MKIQYTSQPKDIPLSISLLRCSKSCTQLIVGIELWEGIGDAVGGTNSDGWGELEGDNVSS